MSLLDFSHKKERLPVEPQPYMRIIFPANAPIAAPADQWRRLPDGRVEVTYWTVDDFVISMTITAHWKEFEDQRRFRRADSGQQLEMFPNQTTGYEV